MTRSIATLATGWSLLAAAALGDPFADEVVSYDPGSPAGSAAFQDNGLPALGEPTRVTVPASAFGGDVGVFSPAFGPDELVTIGPGGHLTVAFDEPVLNDPLNPFGIDLLIFGNAFLSTGDGVTATGGVFAEPGIIEVSQDGIAFVEVPGVFADTAFATLGFEDASFGPDFRSSRDGSIATDFTLPVDPDFEITAGLTESEINAAYAGSGGGTGVDLDLVGLDWIRFVRITDDPNAAGSPEIDAFADVAAVPETSGLLLLAAAAGLGCATARRRRASRSS